MQITQTQRPCGRKQFQDDSTYIARLDRKFHQITPDFQRTKPNPNKEALRRHPQNPSKAIHQGLVKDCVHERHHEQELTIPFSAFAFVGLPLKKGLSAFPFHMFYSGRTYAACNNKLLADPFSVCFDWNFPMSGMRASKNKNSITRYRFNFF